MGALCGSNISLQNIFFSILLIVLALLSRSFPVVTQIRGHIAGPFPPPTLARAFLFVEKRSAFSSRADLYLPTLLDALSS